MKYAHIALFVVAISISAFLVAGEDDSGSKRNILLRRPTNRLAAKSTTTTPAPREEDLGDEEYPEQEQGEGGDDTRNEEEEAHEEENTPTTSTSTEPPKKIGPVIRPFRTNDDFLTALKRRQQNAKKVGHSNPKVEKAHHKEEEQSDSDNDDAPETPVVKSSKVPPRRTKFGKSLKPAPEQPESSNDEESAPAPALRRPIRPGLKAGRY